jgi:hypothetical protein
VTPDPVLRASGHVDRFTDYMVTDLVTGDCHRADHLLKGALEALLEQKAKPLSPEEVKVRPVQATLSVLGTVRILVARILGQRWWKLAGKFAENRNWDTPPLPPLPMVPWLRV